MWTVSGALHNIIIKYLTKLETGFEGQRSRWRRRHLFQFSLFILYHLIWRTFKRFISSGHCGHIEYLSSINSMHCFTYMARRGGGRLARERVSWHTHLAIYDFDWSSTAAHLLIQLYYELDDEPLCISGSPRASSFLSAPRCVLSFASVDWWIAHVN